MHTHTPVSPGDGNIYCLSCAKILHTKQEEPVKLMNNDTLETNAAIFRWSPRSKSLVVTAGNTQFELNSTQALELLEMLYQHRSELFRGANNLPDWLQDDEPTPGPRSLPVPTVDPAGTNVWLDERRY